MNYDKYLNKPHIESKLRNCVTLGPEIKKKKLLPALLKDSDFEALFECLNLMVNGESFEDVVKNKDVSSIIKSLSTKNFDKIIGKRYDNLNPDDSGFRFSIFHSTSYLEWKRSKAKILQVIKHFNLEALLLVTPQTYEATHDETVMFQGLDFILCYFILSLVHFKLFKTIEEELKFFTHLSISERKTHDCIKWINQRVANQLPYVSSEYGGKEALNRIYLRLKDSDSVYMNEVMYQDSLYRENVKIHYYFNGDLFSEKLKEISFDFLETRVNELEKLVKEKSQKNQKLNKDSSNLKSIPV